MNGIMNKRDPIIPLPPPNLGSNTQGSSEQHPFCCRHLCLECCLGKVSIERWGFVLVPTGPPISTLFILSPFSFQPHRCLWKTTACFSLELCGLKERTQTSIGIGMPGDSDTMFWDDFDRILWKITVGKSIFLVQIFTRKLFNQLFIG